MKFLILFVLITAGAFGAENKDMLFTLGESSVVFTRIDGVIVNKGCKTSCEALKKAKDAGNILLPSELLIGGKNPAAVKCKHFMGGTVIIGTDKEGNEQSFCKFSDGSYLNNSSIL